MKHNPKIPLAVGIEIKLNKTDKTWEDEMDYLCRKLTTEVPEQKWRRYVIFLSTRKNFQFKDGYKEWIEKNRDKVKVHSNKEELRSKY